MDCHNLGHPNVRACEAKIRRNSQFVMILLNVLFFLLSEEVTPITEVPKAPSTADSSDNNTTKELGTTVR